jgi:hypothetical protein
MARVIANFTLARYSLEGKLAEPDRKGMGISHPEWKLHHMRVGHSAKIHIDTYGTSISVCQETGVWVVRAVNRGKLHTPKYYRANRPIR